MVSSRLLLAVAGLVLLCSAASAQAGEYRDPSGFSFRHPDDWVAINRHNQGKVSQQNPAEAVWVARNNIDLNRFSVILVRKGQGDFRANLTIEVNGEELPLNEGTVQDFRTALPQQLGVMSIKVDNFQARLEKIVAGEALVIEYNSQIPGVPFPVRQKQVLFPKAGKTFMIVCKAKADTYPQDGAAFEQVIATFRPSGSQEGFVWQGILIASAVGAAVGGIVGGGLVLIKALAGKRKALVQSD